jgi:hypothetical protein
MKTIDFKSEFAKAIYIEIDLKTIRNAELMLWDYNMDKDFEITLESLFDDECNTEDKQGLDKCYYLKLVETVPDAPRGAGTDLLKTSMAKLSKPNSIFCLYASPIAPDKKLYPKKDYAIYLEKLKAVYEKIGFKTSDENNQVMFKYT